MKGRGGEEVRSAYALNWISKYTYAASVTKNSQTARYVARTSKSNSEVSHSRSRSGSVRDYTIHTRTWKLHKQKDRSHHQLDLEPAN